MALVSYSKYSYPQLYGPANFPSYPQDCPIAPTSSADREGSSADFNDYAQVLNCELVGLSDLKTNTNFARDELAGYLNQLLADGVSGFRVDAAKHIGQTDLLAIESRLRKTVDGQKPFIALEVGAGSPGRISPNAFEREGKLLGFDYAQQLVNAFHSYSSPPNDGNIGDLKYLWQLRPAAARQGIRVRGEPRHRAQQQRPVVELHGSEQCDRQRVHACLPVRSARGVRQLRMGKCEAHRPHQRLSAVRRERHGDRTNCTDGTWVCVDRTVAGMVGFHNYVRSTPVRNWWDDGVNLVSFSRGSRGWITINNETTAQTRTFSTALPAGSYCDIVHGAKQGHACTGATVIVNGNGHATVTVASYDAVAIDGASKIS